MIRQFLVILLLVITQVAIEAQSWSDAVKNKTASLDIYWYTSVPFIYKAPSEKMAGIEFEILNLFQDYLYVRHDIALSLNWREHANFSGILGLVKDREQPNTFGVSAFSITKERESYLQFSQPYLPDVTVLVSSKGTPILNSPNELEAFISSSTAVTISGTTYEGLLQELKQKLNVDFDIVYIESDQNVLDNIKLADDRFGYIDLPIYLMLIKSGGELTRQNLFTKKGTGYGFIMPDHSDWSEPLNAFLQDSEYAKRISAIMSKYLGSELYSFIENMELDDQIGTSILTKEKELQLALIKNANLRLEEGEATKKLLSAGMISITVFLLIIAVLFYKNYKTTLVLGDQKRKIEAQQQDIEVKNVQLTNRNQQLIKLNEDKNHLVKVLAHDLRSPLSQIIGFASVLGAQRDDSSKEYQDLTDGILHNGHRINQMITKILDTDALERSEGLVHFENVDVLKLIDELLTRFDSASREKQITLTTKIAEDKLSINTDHMLLYLVLENLISNALKFSPMKKEVNISVELLPTSILFKIKDQGPGLSESDKEKAFRRFQKLDARPTGNETSIGLGLSIVKKYVSDLGGKVWVESFLGEGSTFFVNLPL